MVAVKRLQTGYWLVRWNQNLFIQWPTNRNPVLADGFGWIEKKHLNEAMAIVAALKETTDQF